MILALTSQFSVAQVGTAKFRQRINQDLPSNNTKAITAAKLRSVFIESANSIDSIYTNLSMANSVGEYDASTGIAKVTATGATSTPGTTPAFANGNYFDVVKPGSRTITGEPVSMVEGGRIIVRGTKWGYIPPNDLALRKVVHVESSLFTLDTLGNSIFTGTPSGRSNVTLAYVQQTQVAAKSGLATKVKLATQITGGFTTRNLALVLLRRNNTTGKYVEFSKTTLAVSGGVQEIDLTAYNLQVQQYDAFAIQVLESNLFMWYTSVSGHGYGVFPVPLVSGKFETNISNITTSNANNETLMLDVTVQSSYIPDLYEKVDSVEDSLLHPLSVPENLFNVQGIEDTKYVNSSSGYVLNTGAEFVGSGYIPVVAGQVIKIRGVAPIGNFKAVQYSNSSGVVPGTPGVVLNSSIYANGEFTITIPATCTFIYFTLRIPTASGESAYDYSQVRVYVSSTATYTNQLNSKKIMATSVEPAATMSGVPLKTALAVPVLTEGFQNLFNVAGIEPTKYINSSTGFIFNNGTDFVGSGYIAVTPSSQIKIKGVAPRLGYKAIQFSDEFKVIVPATPGLTLDAGLYANSEFTVNIPAGVYNVFFTVRVPDALGEAAFDYSAITVRTVGAAETVSKLNGKKISASTLEFGATLGGNPVATTAAKSTMSALTPARIFTVCNDTQPTTSLTYNRNYSAAVYIDHMLNIGSTTKNIYVKETGSDKYVFYSPVTEDGGTTNGNVNVLKTNKSWTITGEINDIAVTVQHVSTKTSVGKATQVRYLQIGDSNTKGPESASINVDANYPFRAYEFVKLYYDMDKVDAGSPSGDYNLVVLGTTSARTTSVSYKSGTLTARTQGEGSNGWSVFTYLYHADLRAASQGTWDLLGLGNGSGTDYTGSTSQINSIYSTREGVNTPSNTSAFISYMNATYGGITTYSQALTKANDLLVNPVNKFFDKDKVGAYAFSFAKYLSRYKTLADDGVTRLTVGSTAGTKVTNSLDWDLCTPTHVYIQLGTNDRDKTTSSVFAANVQAMITDIKAVNAATIIGFHMPDGTGTYFPKLYPEFNELSTHNAVTHTAAIAFNTALQGLDNEASKVFFVPAYFIQPTAYGTPVRNTPLAESIGQTAKSEHLNYYVRHTNAPYLHLNNNANAAIGYQMYAWIKYSLSL